ncbi:hypothetical protein HDU79_001956 [Rhizoclosmatium sp. JEL0117]|nr:hypothetical protein HDU79_001956 [Rhizoclosmatium sp. JEL0117]
MLFSLSLLSLAAFALAQSPSTNVTVQCVNFSPLALTEIEILLANGTNVGPQGVASMSSQEGGPDSPWPASNCNDGLFDQACFTNENNDHSPYIQITVPVSAKTISVIKVFKVGNIDIGNGCTLVVTDSVDGIVQQRNLLQVRGDTPPEYTFVMNYVTSTTVRISCPQEKMIFSKLEVYDYNGTHVAISSYATFSSPYSACCGEPDSYPASNCLTGRNLNGNQIYCMTGLGDNNPWWQTVIPSDINTLSYLKVFPQDSYENFFGCTLTVAGSQYGTSPVMTIALPNPDANIDPFVYNITKPSTSIKVQCINFSGLALTEIEAFTADGTNVALQGNVTMSSVQAANLPFNCNDGLFVKPCFTSVNNDPNPWIQVVVPVAAKSISTIKVWKKGNIDIGNGCAVIVTDSIDGVVQRRNLQQIRGSNPPAYVLAMNYVNYTTVQISCPHAILCFNKLEVYDENGVNVALNSYATQSSPYSATGGQTDSYPAVNCLDGKNLNGNLIYCMTSKTETNPWWKTVIPSDINTLMNLTIYPQAQIGNLLACTLQVTGSQSPTPLINMPLPAVLNASPAVIRLKQSN